MRDAIHFNHNFVSLVAAEEGKTAACHQQQQQSARNNEEKLSESNNMRSRMSTAQVEKYINVLRKHGFNLDKLCNSLPEWPREKLAQFWKNHKRARETMLKTSDRFIVLCMKNVFH